MRTGQAKNYLAIREAARERVPALYGGTPDNEIVTRLRDQGYDVGDGEALQGAKQALWAAVDHKALNPFIRGKEAGSVVPIEGDWTKNIPGLRTPTGGGLTHLRPSHALFPQVQALLRGDRKIKGYAEKVPLAEIVFDRKEVEKLSRRLHSDRRKARSGSTRRMGRPSLIAEVQSAIIEVAGKDKLNALDSLKALTREVNRIRPRQCPVSADTVRRALALLYEKTQDRRYLRFWRPRKARNQGGASDPQNSGASGS